MTYHVVHIFPLVAKEGIKKGRSNYGFKNSIRTLHTSH